jgi:hypothetical protein
MNIPFNNFDTEIKPRVSGIDVSYNIDNIRSSMILAGDEVIDLVGTPIYELAITHYESASYEQPGYETLTGLVHATQDVMSYMAFYYHLPYLNIRVSNDGITRIETANEKTAYKYQEDALRESLLNNAWNRADKLIDYVNANRTAFKYWEPDLAILTGDIYWVASKGLYYEATADFTSSENFDDDIANWTELDKDDEIVFWQWSESENYTMYLNSIFQNYKTFGKYIGLERSPYFYIKSRFIIDEIVETEIKTRFDYDTLIHQLRYNALTSQNTVILEKTRAFISRKTLALAIERMDYYALPGPFRIMLSNEYKSNESQIDKKNHLAGKYHLQADAYAKRLDDYLAKIKQVAQATYTENYRITDSQQSTDKYFAAL